MSMIDAFSTKRTPRLVSPAIRDREFLPEALEILETPISPIRSALMLTICGFASCAILWACVGKVDIIATAQGKIQPVGQTKTAQPLEAGKIVAIEIRDGQHVRAGDVLIRLDPSEALRDEAALTDESVALAAEASRRRAALDAAAHRDAALAPPDGSAFPADVWERQSLVLTSDLARLASEVAGLEAKRSEKLAEREGLKKEIAAQQRLIETLKERVDMREELFERKVEAKASVIDARQTLEAQETSLATLESRLSQVEAELGVAARAIDSAYSAFTSDNAEKLAEVERQIGETRQKLAKARLKIDHLDLKSPIDGTVQGLTATTLGQVVASGDQLMQIVPERPALEIVAYMPNSDIGFVGEGQTAVVKVDSFPFIDYGTLNAEVTRVAQDAIPLEDAARLEQNPIDGRGAPAFGGGQRTQNLVYPLTLRLERATVPVDGADVRLSPGMAVTVEVKTGSRRIISYLFAPLAGVFATAMRER
jgi:hemolysin D